jgi:hypothetical protein
MAHRQFSLRKLRQLSLRVSRQMLLGWGARLLPIPGSLSRRGHEPRAVLLPHAQRFSMATRTRRLPLAVFYGLPRAFPEAFQNRSDSCNHWEHTAGGRVSAVRHEQSPAASVRPDLRLLPEPETFLGT